jgi:uracil-DNA glycosylase family 4
MVVAGSAMTMDLEDGTIAVLEELKRQRQEGVDAVYLEQETIDGLRAALGSMEIKVAAPVASELKPEPKPTPQPAPVEPIASSSAPPVEVAEVKPKPITKPVRKAEPAGPSVLPPPPDVNLPDGDPESRMSWLRDLVVACPTCNANLNPGSKVVFGVGNPSADVFFCGEAPGNDEEIKGEPFVGAAGQLLDKIISATGLTREGVYIGNVMNWRPQHDQAFGNRPPTEEEMNFCLPYLKAQLEVVQPKVIVVLGRTAANALVQPDPSAKMGDVRGRWWEFEGVPLMVTYHPSYLLHNPSMLGKRRVWEDVLLVMERLEIPISDKQRGFFQ